MARMSNSLTQPETLTGLKFGDKNEVAKMLGLCRRSIDNLMAAGLPHCKLSPRKVVFDLAEVHAWVKQRYSCQRIGKVSDQVTQPAGQK